MSHLAPRVNWDWLQPPCLCLLLLFCTLQTLGNDDDVEEEEKEERDNDDADEEDEE